MPTIQRRERLRLERDIQAEVKDALNRSGLVYVERHHVAGVISANGGRFRAGLRKGAPDLVGCVLGSGRFFGVEVKRPGRKLDPDQVEWAAGYNTRGAYICRTDSVEMALEHAARAARGERACP